ncbi:LysR family transcriptional regulator [Photobacterium sp. TY1-4]|uniref:LysR family transcriptional regulator n=1 Tax=Photobacterium sp. TY1-4 TaxID=2899122 RepID=UPI0021C25261|nr:LysR family transcriptional regulator [Photobacterium sp. TY1-4]UXI02588.1 LysR substrate-binding domain-containing protein [Photobacterium sp. TY1-4]
MKLPPLRAVQCFEAVARLNSFSQAAVALNVTQSAVSHQVRLLEEYLGESLFNRGGRKLSLTVLGERYFEDISHSLQCISQSSQQIREGECGRLRLALYSSLAVKWLVPRLENFRQLHPEIELTLKMVTEEPEFTDQCADCFVTAHPPRKNFTAEFLYQETLYPFCSQKLWQKIQDQPLPEAIWQQPLLSVHSIFNSEQGADWKTWCELGGFELPAGANMSYFSHMVLAAEAAKYHQGIAFLNDYFLNDQDRQHLVRIPTHELPTGDKLYFTYKHSRARQSEIIALGRWLKQQCFDYEGQ